MCVRVNRADRAAGAAQDRAAGARFAGCTERDGNRLTDGRFWLVDQAAVIKVVVASFRLALGISSGNVLAGVRPFMPQALVRPLGVVTHRVGIEHRLHLLDRLEPGLAAVDPEVLAEQGAVQPLDGAVRLWLPGSADHLRSGGDGRRLRRKAEP